MSQLELVRMENDRGEFYFDNLLIRVVMIDGEPWFVAKDVCDALGIGNVSQTLNYLDDDEKQQLDTNIINSDVGGRGTMVVNESGLYSLILRSRKPEAKRFKKLVTSVILPTIRKHGGYLTADKIEEALRDPDTIIRLATTLKEEQAKRLVAEQKIALDAPKVAYAHGMAVAYNSCLVAELAKKIEKAVNAMCDPKYHLGEKTLYKWLRKHGYVMRRTNEKNLPTQRSLNLGIMEIEHRTVSTPKGIREIRTTRITAKGQEYFVDKFLKAGGTPE